jgi:hypothetical protein
VEFGSFFELSTPSLARLGSDAHRLDTEWWRQPRAAPTLPVVASAALADGTRPRLPFAWRPRRLGARWDRARG